MAIMGVPCQVFKLSNLFESAVAGFVCECTCSEVRITLQHLLFGFVNFCFDRTLEIMMLVWPWFRLAWTRCTNEENFRTTTRGA
jgi:hypothetical protein